MAVLSVRQRARAILCGLTLFAPAAVAAQRPDSAVTARPDTAPPPARRITLTAAPEAKPPISPRRAFLLSLAVPGLGQSRLDRPNAGALFATLEMLSISMAGHAAWDLRYARQHARDSIAATYQTDANGAVIYDANGPVVATWVRNYYAGTTVNARRTHYEDWIAAIIFNHLFAGADAFVAAQLWDVPTHVSVQAAPRRLTIGVTTPLGRRRHP